MHAIIAQHTASIAAICQRFGVRRLDVFGSAARSDDFDPGTSDVDFLVEFAPESTVGLHRFFGTKTALEELLGRPVDLIEAEAIRNPYVLSSINRHREPVYAADSRLCRRARQNGVDSGTGIAAGLAKPNQ